MFQVYLLLGSNQGNKLENLSIAVEKLQEFSESAIQLSSVYESEPWGFETDEWFVNQAIKIETKLKPAELLKTIQDIERSMGRVRPLSTVEIKSESAKSYFSRTLDIDILLYDNQIIDTADLIVPHPRLHLRMFVLKPLHEIASDLVHPLLRKSIRELTEDCKDSLVVRKVNY